MKQTNKVRQCLYRHLSEVLLQAVVQDGVEVDNPAAVEGVDRAVLVPGRSPALLRGRRRLVTQPHH